MRSLELSPKVAPVAAENRACDRFEQDSLGVAHPIRSQEIGASWSMLPRAPRTIIERRGELRVDFV